MLDIDSEQFEKMVSEQLDALPQEMLQGLDNVVFIVQDRPEDGSLNIMGLYDGWALTERGSYGQGELPDRIMIYREPHLSVCSDEEQLLKEIHTTLVHEIAHFYGIDDKKLHELGWG